MRTLTDLSLTVIAFDYNVYKQERNILSCSCSVQAAMAPGVTVNVISGTTTLATYHLNAARKCVIDLTDYLRTYATGLLKVRAMYNDANIGEVSVDWSVVGLISPSRLFVPDTREAAEVRATAQVQHNYLLPSRILQPIASDDTLDVYGVQSVYLLKSTGALHPHTYYLHFEGSISNYPSVQPSDVIIAIYADVFSLPRTYAQIEPYLVDPHDGTFRYDFADIHFTTEDAADQAIAQIQDYVSTQQIQLDGYDLWAVDDGNADTTEKKVTGTTFDNLVIGSTTKTVGIAGTNKNIVQSVAIVPRLCGVNYAAVRWVSATGHKRQATWEYGEHKQQTGDVVSIENVTGEYAGSKGREDGLTLRLDGLTAFDVWYYGDIITSSSVELSLDGSTWRAVKVESKDVTIPDGDGGELQELKVNITYAEYDAVAM